MSKQIKRLTDLQPDPNNANRGTERGLGMLEDSLRKYGAGRSILADREGRVIAGNKTLERAADLGFEDVIVVPSDGTKLVVVQRTDLDLETDPRATALALADNRVGEVDLAWDPAVLAAIARDNPEAVAGMWTPDELAAVMNQPPDVEFKEYDESVENEVDYITCPECGHRWPK